MTLIIQVALLVLSSTCSPSAVCSDVQSIYTGEWIGSIAKLSWSTDDEDAELAYYKITRRDCGNPSACTVDVATVQPTGTCATTEHYQVEDDPPGNNDDWIYTLEVWDTMAFRRCGVDVDPE